MNNHFVKTTWANLRSEIQAVAPSLAQVIDSLSPDDSFSLYTATYPFGTIIGDEKRFYYPDEKGRHFESLEKQKTEVIKELGYAGNSIPMGMVLRNATELYIEGFDFCYPTKLQMPGTFFGLLRELEQNGSSHPAGLQKMTSGARSAFIAPSIGDKVRYTNLQRDFRLKTKLSSNDKDQWQLLTELHNNATDESTRWTSTLLFFSAKWVDKMHTDPSWQALKLYLLEHEWQQHLYRINKPYFDYIFSLTQANKNLKPSPYLANITRYLLSMTVGSSLGFAPARDETAAPIKLFQKILLESYGLRYSPIIMQPAYLKPFEHNGIKHLYYSLNYPINLAFSPRSRESGPVIVELRELKHITNKFMDDLKGENSICKNTLTYQILQSLEIEYFHNKADLLRETELTTTLPDRDPWLCKNIINDKALPFPDSSAFFRACVCISKKKTELVLI